MTLITILCLIGIAIIILFVRALSGTDSEIHGPGPTFNRHQMPMSTDRMNNGGKLVDGRASWQRAKEALEND